MVDLEIVHPVGNIDPAEVFQIFRALEFLWRIQRPPHHGGKRFFAVLLGLLERDDPGRPLLIPDPAVQDRRSSAIGTESRRGHIGGHDLPAALRTGIDRCLKHLTLDGIFLFFIGIRIQIGAAIIAVELLERNIEAQVSPAVWTIVHKRLLMSLLSLFYLSDLLYHRKRGDCTAVFFCLLIVHFLPGRIGGIYWNEEVMW